MAWRTTRRFRTPQNFDFHTGGALASEAEFKIDGQKTGKGTAFGHAEDTNSRAQALALYGSSAKRMEPYGVDDVAFVRARLASDDVWRGLGYDAVR